ncbi:hypothetical protein H9P43_001008 [Blastocladiella emersonii ATCC 22665]|nr:hypothetical protein H9P43_001008 [Blastocladiella emersonii ATCC 22665]
MDSTAPSSPVSVSAPAPPAASAVAFDAASAASGLVPDRPYLRAAYAGLQAQYSRAQEKHVELDTDIAGAEAELRELQMDIRAILGVLVDVRPELAAGSDEDDDDEDGDLDGEADDDDDEEDADESFTQQGSTAMDGNDSDDTDADPDATVPSTPAVGFSRADDRMDLDARLSLLPPPPPRSDLAVDDDATQADDGDQDEDDEDSASMDVDR